MGLNKADKKDFDRKALRYFLLLCAPFLFVLAIYYELHSELLLPNGVAAFLFLGVLILVPSLLILALSFLLTLFIPSDFYPQKIRCFLSQLKICWWGSFFSNAFFSYFYVLINYGWPKIFPYFLFLVFSLVLIFIWAYFWGSVQRLVEIKLHRSIGVFLSLVMPISTAPIIYLVLFGRCRDYICL